MFSGCAASLEMLAKSCHWTYPATDYESKEQIGGVPQSLARRALLITHTVREFGKLRRFGQNIPQQKNLIQLPSALTKTTFTYFDIAVMKNRDIAAPDLATAMRWFVSNLSNQGLNHFFLSTDHSPSEQIEGQEWHHSILVVSQNVEHQAVADELGKALNPQAGKLKQWKDAGQHYRIAFHQLIFHTLKKHPVLVYGISAKESAVLQHEAAFADALGITGCYRRIEVNGKTKVEFGPYFHSDDNPPRTLVVSERHAPMAIHLAHSLLRVHTHLQAAVDQKAEYANSPIWFQVMSDKPPIDFTGPYAELMWLLLGGTTTAGKFTWGGFTGNDDQPVDLLSDNLAGMISDMTTKPHLYIYQGPPLELPINGVFYWDRFE